MNYYHIVVPILDMLRGNGHIFCSGYSLYYLWGAPRSNAENQGQRQQWKIAKEWLLGGSAGKANWDRHPQEYVESLRLLPKRQGKKLLSLPRIC